MWHPGIFVWKSESHKMAKVFKTEKATRHSWAHLDGVDQSHESQAAEVDVKSITERPDQVVVWWLLARMAHVDHRGAASLTAGLTVSERSAVVHVAVCGVIHPWRSGVETPGRIWRGITEEKDQDYLYDTEDGWSQRWRAMEREVIHYVVAATEMRAGCCFYTWTDFDKISRFVKKNA